MRTTEVWWITEWAKFPQMLGSKSSGGSHLHEVQQIAALLLHSRIRMSNLTTTNHFPQTIWIYILISDWRGSHLLNLNRKHWGSTLLLPGVFVYALTTCLHLSVNLSAAPVRGTTYGRWHHRPRSLALSCSFLKAQRAFCEVQIYPALLYFRQACGGELPVADC